MHGVGYRGSVGYTGAAISTCRLASDGSWKRSGLDASFGKKKPVEGWTVSHESTSSASLKFNIPAHL